MAWVKGQSGNPLGYRPERLVHDMVRRVVTQDQGKRLRQGVEIMLTRAANGDAPSLEWIANRLDGRPAQQIDAIASAGGPGAAVQALIRVVFDSPGQIIDQAPEAFQIEEAKPNEIRQLDQGGDQIPWSATPATGSASGAEDPRQAAQPRRRRGRPARQKSEVSADSEGVQEVGVNNIEPDR